MAAKLNSRAAAAQIAWQVIDQNKSFDLALDQILQQEALAVQDRSFVQELSYGLLRWYWPLDKMAAQLLDKPIRNKDRVIHFVLLTGLYQLAYLDTPAHAALSETVKACQQLKKGWAKNLINGCLRQYQRQPLTPKQALDKNQSHPAWLAEKITATWPEHERAILSANNQRGPLCLRVNTMRTSQEEYLAQLQQAGIVATNDAYSVVGLRLAESLPVSKLPGFMDGVVSVQDTAAQLACTLLQPEKGHTILDACAAPGGKTAHILEHTENLAEVTAVDISEKRLESLQQTLQRLHLNAELQAADASQTLDWTLPKNGYDRILIDAPCSGTGVIRRHPDIKHHRRTDDINQLMEIQSALLKQLWPCLASGGKLLYMTCSILSDENEQQIEHFLSHCNDAKLATIKHPNALTLQYGCQTLPGVHDMDGFYYCLLEKP